MIVDPFSKLGSHGEQQTVRAFFTPTEVGAPGTMLVHARFDAVPAHCVDLIEAWLTIVHVFA